MGIINGKQTMKILAFLISALLINAVHADVNKCLDSNGKITFTDAVCKKGQVSTIVKINPINIANGSGDRQAIYEVKRNEYKQAQARYYSVLRNSATRANARAYEDEAKRTNEQRISRSKSPLPNGLGSGKGCYKESNQYYCY